MQLTLCATLRTPVTLIEAEGSSAVSSVAFRSGSAMFVICMCSCTTAMSAAAAAAQASVLLLRALLLVSLKLSDCSDARPCRFDAFAAFAGTYRLLSSCCLYASDGVRHSVVYMLDAPLRA